MTSTTSPGDPARERGAVAITDTDEVRDPAEDLLMLPELALPVRPRPPVAPAPGRPAAWLGGLTVVGLILRLVLVDQQSLWLDETLSLKQAAMPLRDMWQFQLTENVHVPLYHTILHFWIEPFGTSATSLRLLSVLFGTAALPLLYLVVRRVLGTRVALIATALAAASPFWVWHADEARMYPLVLCCGLGSLVLLFRAADRGGWWRWVMYAAMTGIGFYSHYFLLLMPPVHLGWILWQHRTKGKIAAWVASMVAAGGVFVPWAVLLVTNRFGGSGATFTNHGQDYLNGLSAFGVVYAMVIFVAVFLVGYHSEAVLGIISAVLVGIWPLVAVAAAVRRGRRARPDALAGGLFLAGWLVAQVVAVYVLDQWQPGLWYQKYLVMCSVPLLALLALVLDRMGRRLAVVIVATTVVLSGASIASNVESDNPVRQDWAAASASVHARFQRGDVIAVLPAFNSNALQYYWDDPTPVWGLVRHSYEVDQTLAVDINQIEKGHAGATLWVVSSHTEGFDPGDRVLNHLRATLPELSREEFPAEIVVESFLLPPAATTTAK